MCKLLTEIHANKDYDWENEDELYLVDVCPIFATPESGYIDLVHYLQQGNLPEHWNSMQRGALWLNLASYQIINGVLFRKNYYGVFLMCLEK